MVESNSKNHRIMPKFRSKNAFFIKKSPYRAYSYRVYRGIFLDFLILKGTPFTFSTRVIFNEYCNIIMILKYCNYDKVELNLLFQTILN